MNKVNEKELSYELFNFYVNAAMSAYEGSDEAIKAKKRIEFEDDAKVLRTSPEIVDFWYEELRNRVRKQNSWHVITDLEMVEFLYMLYMAKEFGPLKHGNREQLREICHTMWICFLHGLNCGICFNDI